MSSSDARAPTADGKTWAPIPTMRVMPNMAVVDEPMDVVVNGLLPNAAATIAISSVLKGTIHCGFGHFYADGAGDVVVHKQPSLGGTYTGVRRMGLFTSARQFFNRNIGTRFLMTGPADTMIKYRVYCFKGHVSSDLLYSLISSDTLRPLKFDGCEQLGAELFARYHLVSQTINRVWLDANVQRIPIKVTHNETLIYGTMFLPRGNGPFPGVIDLFGGAGGCIEVRAALLAKHGYATFALAYFGYKDLAARSFLDFRMTYFSHAIDWFCAQAEICSSGIGMVGVSLGSQCTLLMAIREPRIKAAVCINSPMLWVCDPKLIGNPSLFNTDNLKSYPRLGLHALIGANEERMQARVMLPALVDHLKSTGRSNVTVEVIPGQGHLIEPPYTPMCTESRDGAAAVSAEMYDFVHPGILVLSNYVSRWGGDEATHEETQMYAWHKLLAYLKKNLCDDNPDYVQKYKLKAKI